VKVGIFDHVSIRLGGSQLVVARMAEFLASTYQVEVIHSGKGYTLSKLGTAFQVDLSGVKERIVEDSLGSFAIPGPKSMKSCLLSGFQTDRALTRGYDLFVYSGHGAPPFCFANHGLVYCHFPFETRPSCFGEATSLGKRMSSGEGWLRRACYRYLWNRRMRGYGMVLANSQFSAQWIKQLWGMESEVINPPVALDGPRLAKKNAIVSLGRFIETDRKNLVQQIKAFPDFLGRSGGGWVLWLVGFCSDSPQDQRFLKGLREMAEGLPVEFIVNADRDVVIRRLAEAKMFWHTAGLEGDKENEPRYMEHFGIATVEAMRVGCVPVVPACGGQPEIVEHQVSGFLCDNAQDLVRNSVLIAANETLFSQMSHHAMQRSESFRPVIFQRQFTEKVSECLGRGHAKGKTNSPQSVSSTFRI